MTLPTAEFREQQVAHSAGLLNGRIDGHDEKNENQFRVIESTIREVASQIRTEIADLETRIEKRLTDFQTQTENERRFTKLETQMGGGSRSWRARWRRCGRRWRPATSGPMRRCTG